jgi:hypothetical protein
MTARTGFSMLWLVLALGHVGDAAAQLKGHYIPGFMGLQSGSQPPPSISDVMPLYFYTTDEIKNDDGNSIGTPPRVNVSFVGAGVAWVTNWKLLGGNVGGSVIPVAFIQSRLEGASLAVPGQAGFAGGKAGDALHPGAALGRFET